MAGKFALKNWPLGGKMAAVAAAPLAMLLAVGGAAIVERWQTAQEMTRLDALIDASYDIAKAMHEVQKERGATSGLLAASDQGDFASRLEAQRRATDSAAEGLRASAGPLVGTGYGDDFDGEVRAALDALQGLAAVRAGVDAGRLAADEAIPPYTETVLALLDIVDEKIDLSGDDEIDRAVGVLIELMQKKEAAGQERALGAAAYAAGYFAPEAHARFLQLAGTQSLALFEFLDFAEDEQVTFYERTMARVEDGRFAAMRAELAEAPFAGSLDPARAGAWFDVATRRIDALRSVESRVIADLRAQAEAVRIAAERQLWLVAAEMLAALAAAMLLAYAILRATVRPLNRMTVAMGGLAGGDLDVEVGDTARRDEIGGMARALAHFRETGREARDLAAARERERAEAEEAKRAAVRRMAETIETETATAVDRVAAMSGRMDEGARDMAAASDAVQRDSQAVAAAAEQALSNAQAVAAASEELSASIAEIAQQVGQATRTTAQTVAVGDKAKDRIAQLSSAVDQIGQVADLIGDIAEQTNLLALNATIEAARAGEAGKGFAVVAGEVKALATQTANSTEQIARHIAEVQAVTREAVASMGEVGDNIQRIDEVATAIAAAIEEQSGATGEIARNVQETSSAARDVAARIADVSGRAEETGTQAAAVGGLSGELHEAVAALRSVLVRVVRTSTEEADRRNHARYPFEAPVEIAAGGRTLSATVRDISRAGLSVVVPEGTPATALHGRLSVAVPGLDGRLEAEAIQVDGTFCRLRFGETDAARADLAALIDRLARQTARAA